MTCKPTFDSAVSGWSDILDPAFGAFTAALTLAAHCDFAKDAPALISRRRAVSLRAARPAERALPAKRTTNWRRWGGLVFRVVTNAFECDVDGADAVDAAIFETCMDQGLTTGALRALRLGAYSTARAAARI